MKKNEAVNPDEIGDTMQKEIQKPVQDELEKLKEENKQLRELNASFSRGVMQNANKLEIIQKLLAEGWTTITQKSS